MYTAQHRAFCHNDIMKDLDGIRFFYVKQSMHVEGNISETVIFIHRVNNAVGMVSFSESGQKNLNIVHKCS